MPGLIVTISGTIVPLEKELRNAERAAIRTGQRISAGLGGGGGHGDGHSGIRGSLMESIVIMREVLEGRGLSRTLGSFTLLGQRMGWLKFLFKETSSSAEILAESYAHLAQKSGLAEIAAIKKASASQVALAADLENTEATFNQALADEVGARAASANALAMRMKAEAAGQSALAQESAAAATLGAGATIVGILVAVAVAGVAAYKQTTALIEKLAGVKMPDFDPAYIPKYLQKVNQVGEIQKEINLEIEKSIVKYNSAASAAERVEKATKAHYDHLRKMNDLQKQVEMGPKKSGAEKETIDKKYSDLELQINKAERNADMVNRYIARANLIIEGRTLRGKADSILTGVNSKAHDDEVVRLNKQKYDAANEAAQKVTESKMQGTFGINGRDIFRAYNNATDSGVNTDDLNKAEAQIIADRARYKKVYQDSVDRAHDNEKTRQPGEDFAKQAAESFSKAAVLGLEINDQKKKNFLADSDEASEAAAKLNADKAKERIDGPQGLNQLQKLGAFTAQGGNPLLDQARTTNRLLQTIVSQGSSNSRNHQSGALGAVQH